MCFLISLVRTTPTFHYHHHSSEYTLLKTVQFMKQENGCFYLGGKNIAYFSYDLYSAATIFYFQFFSRHFSFLLTPLQSKKEWQFPVAS